jgi:hypothetical protein
MYCTSATVNLVKESNYYHTSDMTGLKISPEIQTAPYANGTWLNSLWCRIVLVP